MRGFHEVPPQPRRRAAARDSVHGPAIVIAQPDAGNQLSGIAQEPGVPVILAGPGLAGGGPANPGISSGAALNGNLQHAVHFRHMPRSGHFAPARALAAIENISRAIPHLQDAVG